MTADLLGCRKRLRITFLRAQRLHHLVRFVARTELADTDAKPGFAVVLDLRNIGVVAFILKPINYLLSRALIRKSIHLGAPSLARLFRFAQRLFSVFLVRLRLRFSSRLFLSPVLPFWQQRFLLSAPA